MSARYRCNECLHEFTVSEDMGSQSCPYCGSFELTEKSGGSKINLGKFKKFLMPAVIFIVVIILIRLLIKDCKVVIDDVVYEKNKCRITVTARTTKKGGKLEYSFDNGKTSQTSRFFLVKDPGTYTVVVNSNNCNNATWGVPITVSEADLKGCTPPPPPPQIVSIEPINETVVNGNDGQIIIHTLNGERPLEFSINSGATWSSDSVFNNLQPGKYLAQVKDALTRTSGWQDTIVIEPGGPNGDPPEGGTLTPPTKHDVEILINNLFNDPDNQELIDSVYVLFINKTMNVDCELIGIAPNTPYQLFQFLERRFDGKPGSKRIEVIAVETSGNRISKLKVKEVAVN